ncbi:DNA-binding response regulator [Mariprofundus sp. EBB-1]|uniref:response regulator transcription factor n=1 Tax=Mariprofundus sp. EBB-1 TaxID=2650971 RepID=UPI000EF273BF|nr:response regulator transcription factor [Mariprofundus sp. EBB-1]RLL53689.1 DNA-binding response regulator [Mariprofundus sp. EBB-1]
MRLLLVEDDEMLSANLTMQLKQHGFAVDTVFDGTEALFMGENEPYDVIILDLGLPEVSGIDVLKQWRSKQVSTPVLILTARDAWHEKVDGFRAGADDYLSKPFHIEELLARIDALIRRSKGNAGGQIESGNFRLDEATQSVSKLINHQPVTISLTGVEFRLLRYLMLHPGHVFSDSHLLEHVYNYDSEKESNVIEVYISKLRKKLGKTCILNRRGQGYLFNPDQA